MVSLETKDTTSKYTQQHTIDVADAPGHQIRIYEIHRVFGRDAPVVQGVRMKENWIRGTSDYVKENGPGSSYGEYVMENGDRFQRTCFSTQSRAGISR